MRVQNWVFGIGMATLLLGASTAIAYDAEFDYNGDGFVDQADLDMINDAFNLGEDDPGYDPIFDHDADGVIGGSDILSAQEAVRADSQ